MKNLISITAAIFACCILPTACCFSQGTAINNNGISADNSAILDVSSTTKGMLMPRMTTAQRNAVVSPAEGLLIFNTSTKCFESYVNGAWYALSCPAACVAPSAPSAGTHTPLQTQITWNWNTVSGAVGYKWNTTNDYSTATDNGSNTSYSQTGLNCGTAYTLYVWAYNTCGNSSATTLSQSTDACFSCGSGTVTFTYRGSQVTYGTVNGQNGTCWLDRNLGASQVATSSTDANAYGDLFQWGRLDDGHQSRTSSLTSTHSPTDVPGHSNFIGYMFMPAPYDWRSPQNDSLWQKISDINNPCPSGWRVPDKTELSNEMNSWVPVNSTGAYQSALKWTVAGLRDSNGTLFWVGSNGGYRSLSLEGTSAWYLNFYSSGAYMGSYGRAVAMSIRCIKK